MKVKRILHLYETCGPGGAEKVIVDIVRGLDPDKYHSTVVLLVEGWLTHQLKNAGVSPIHLPQRGAFDPRTVLELLRLVRNCRIDLIHAHEFFTNALGFLVATLARIPIIATVHGKSYYTDKSRRILAYRILARYADCFVSVSEDLENFLAKTIGIPASRITTVYNGIDLNQYAANGRSLEKRLELGLKATSPIVGTVGSLYPVKGHTYLLQALRDILKCHPETMLLLIGKGELQDVLRDEARAYGIYEQVRFLGFREDIKELLEIIDIFVLPSISEGLPLSLLEAMAMAKPVVATRVGGIPEVVIHGQTGLLVPPWNSRFLAEGILFLLRNSHVAKQMGGKGREQIAKMFTFKQTIARYEQLYSECMS